MAYTELRNPLFAAIIKFGVDIVHNYDILNNLYESNGYITYGYVSNFLSDLAAEGKSTDNCNSSALPTATATTSAVGSYPCYSSFVQGFGATPEFQIATLDYGFYAQDNWKVSPRLTVQMVCGTTTRSCRVLPPTASSRSPRVHSFPSTGSRTCPATRTTSVPGLDLRMT